MNRASHGYHGEGKTDARDALVSAGQARIRRSRTSSLTGPGPSTARAPR
ncbi:hypothetical protein [Streptomyces sp. NPDC085540]